MKKLIKTLALVAIGVAVGRVRKSNTYTITDRNDDLLVDIYNSSVIFHDDVKVYVNGKLLT